MLCSHARNQPACFSGRTAAAPLIQGRGRLTHGQWSCSILQATSTVYREAGLVDSIATVQRGGVHSFDKQPSFPESQAADEKPKKMAGRSRVASQMGKGQRGQSTYRQRHRKPSKADQEATLDRALQDLRAGGLDEEQMVELVSSVSWTLRSAPAQIRRELQAHAVIKAAQLAVQSAIQKFSDESIVRIAIEFGEMEAVGFAFDGLQDISRLLTISQNDGTTLRRELRYRLLRTVARSATLQKHATLAVKSIVQGLNVEAATSHQLCHLLLCLAKTGLAAQLAGTTRKAAALLMEKRQELTAWQLYQLILVTNGLQRHLPPRSLQGLVDAFMDKDASLTRPYNLLELLQICNEPGLRNVRLLEATAASLALKMESLTPKSILAALNALAKMRQELSEQCLDALQIAMKQHFYPAEYWELAQPSVIPNALWSIARLQHQPPDAWLDRVCLRSVQCNETSGKALNARSNRAREVATIIWSLGQLQRSVACSDRLFQVAELIMLEANPQDVVFLARGIASLAAVTAVPQTVWDALDKRAASIASACAPLALCQVMCSFGKHRIVPQLLLPVACKLIRLHTERLNMRDVSDLLWTFAMLRHPLPAEDATIVALAKHCRQLLEAQGSSSACAYPGDSYVRELSTIAWAIATLDEAPIKRKSLLWHLLLHARPVSAMSGIDIAKMLWACSKCKADLKELPRYTARIEQLALDLEARQITMILWAYAKLEKHPGIELMEALLSHVVNNITALDTQGIGNTVWACGKLRYHPGPLVAAVRADLQWRGAEYDLNDWSSIIYAFTQLGQDTADILQLAHHMILERRIQPDVKLISTILWSCAVFEHFPQPIFRAMMRLLDKVDPAEVDEESLTRIHQAHLLACLVDWCQPKDVSSAFQLKGEPRQWMAQLLEEDQSQLAAQQYRSIGETLHKLNLPHSPGHRVHVGRPDALNRGLKLGMVLRRPWGTKRMVAIELLSPKKLTINTHQPLWKVLYKSACLCACGYDVLWVPFSEWDAAVARGIQEEYLTSRIDRLLTGLRGRIPN